MFYIYIFVYYLLSLSLFLSSIPFHSYILKEKEKERERAVIKVTLLECINQSNGTIIEYIKFILKKKIKITLVFAPLFLLFLQMTINEKVCLIP
jgi:hypothetical protein